MDVLNQSGCIMKWTLGRGKLLSHVDCVNNRVTISGLVRIEIKFSDRCEVTHFFFLWGGGGGGGGRVIRTPSTCEEIRDRICHAPTPA